MECEYDGVITGQRVACGGSRLLLSSWWWACRVVAGSVNRECSGKVERSSGLDLLIVDMFVVMLTISSTNRGRCAALRCDVTQGDVGVLGPVEKETKES